MSSTKLTTDNIRSLAASKLSGALPSLDGSNLTNLGDVEVSDSDPSPTSNKNLGQIWMNHSSGESYMCTDETAGSNEWTNIGASGTGDVFKPPYQYQGTQNGFHSGSDVGNQKRVQKFAFSSNTNATLQCDLVHNIARPGTCDDAMNEYGYCFNGGHHASNTITVSYTHLTLPTIYSV